MQFRLQHIELSLKIEDAIVVNLTIKLGVRSWEMALIKMSSFVCLGKALIKAFKVMLIPTLQFCSCYIAAGLRCWAKGAGWRATPIGCSERGYITLLFAVRYETVSAGFVD